MDNSFPEISTFFGFGCMRLPMKGTEIDMDQFKKMVDYYLENGFNYFDTAHSYHGGQSETAIREALTSRHKREEYLLTDKLTERYFKKEADIRPFFQSQLDACGVEYFDFYLMHAQNARNFIHFQKHNAYETAFKLKEECKIRHVGISFHDTPEVLDMILSTYPQIEIVQIQLNYVDYDSPSVQSRKVLDVCRRHGKPAIIMEPVKGGSLIKLPEDAQKIFDSLESNLSNAGYAIRFAASHEGVRLVLSGMSDMEQLKDNVSFMKDFKPLTHKEQEAIARVAAIFRNLDMIQCTSCRYCIEQNRCPKDIRIPDLFACLNTKRVFNNWNQNMYYNIATHGHGKPSQCVGCGGCETVCPQNLKIRSLLREVTSEFEPNLSEAG